MIKYKTDIDIGYMRASADLLGRVHGILAQNITPGVTTRQLDKIAEEFIRDHQASPSFLNYRGFPFSLCISKNEVVVHGLPDDNALVDGDIISIDCGVFLDGYHADSAYTYPIGEVDPEILALMRVTKQCLHKGIEQMIKGKRVGDISFAIQSHAQNYGYSVVRELVGHGVGKNLHEKPDVPNYGKRGRGAKIQNGMVLAIEPMINLGKKEVVKEKDGWTVRTKDRKASAHYEHTVAFHEDKTEILTTFKYIEQDFQYEHA